MPQHEKPHPLHSLPVSIFMLEHRRLSLHLPKPIKLREQVTYHLHMYYGSIRLGKTAGRTPTPEAGSGATCRGDSLHR